jgi:hypothetical protein
MSEENNPLPVLSNSTSEGNKPLVLASSVLEPVSKPAFVGAKFDVRGFCIRHPRCRLVRPLDGKDEGGDGKNCMVFLAAVLLDDFRLTLLCCYGMMFLLCNDKILVHVYNRALAI